MHELFVLVNALGVLCPCFAYKTEPEAQAKVEELNRRQNETATMPFTYIHLQET